MNPPRELEWQSNPASSIRAPPDDPTFAIDWYGARLTPGAHMITDSRANSTHRIRTSSVGTTRIPLSRPRPPPDPHAAQLTDQPHSPPPPKLYHRAPPHSSP